MKISELRKKLSELGLPTSGNKTELANRLNDFSQHIGIAQTSTEDDLSVANMGDDEFVAESIDEGGFRSDTPFSVHRNPVIEESPICLGEFVKEFRQFKQEMMGLKSKVDIMAAEGYRIANSSGNDQADLIVENSRLRETNDELRSEVRKLEQERKSLLLALRLVSESVSKENPMPGLSSNQSSSNQPSAQPQGNANSLHANSENASVNAINTNIYGDSRQDKRTDSDQRNSQEYHINKPVTVIVGDSMVKNVRGWDLSNQKNKVIVKSFSGATTEDMEDYLKPILRKEPQNLILHVGTNDLKAMEPAHLSNSIESLAINIEENSPNTSVSISALLPRKDPQLSKNISLINNSLKSICCQHYWNFIEHRNIKKNHLNRGGVHLSKAGSDLLTNNFKLHISND